MGSRLIILPSVARARDETARSTLPILATTRASLDPISRILRAMALEDSRDDVFFRRE